MKIEEVWGLKSEARRGEGRTQPLYISQGAYRLPTSSCVPLAGEHAAPSIRG